MADELFKIVQTIMIDEARAQFLTARARFVEAVSAFRSWAAGWPVGVRSSYWECDYEEWPAITSAFVAFLDSGSPQLWDALTIETLLYIVARDNEMEILKQELIFRPGHLLALARGTLGCTEADARWQLADALGRVQLADDEVEPLLVRFFHDEDEYVSRRALLALASRWSKEAESLALIAWSTEHEYQRIVALNAFFSVNSPLLSRHLDLAQQDGRKYLVKVANELRSKLSP